jgi:uncharacterized DUF497 family protein
VYECRWNEWNRDKCEKHNVSPHEAEYVVNHPARGFPRKIGSRKRLAIGQAADGTYLQVIFIVDPEGTAFIIHSRPLIEAEKRALRRRRHP